jgi:HKD family nuclease
MYTQSGMMRTLFGKTDGNAAVFGLPAGFDIVQEIKRSWSVRLATAYGKISGWDLLEGAVLRSKAKVYLLAGLNFGLTEPALLWRWLKLSKNHRIHAHVINHRVSFHPKILIVESAGSRREFAIVGSGNLSRGGLLNNIECSLYTEDKGLLRRLTGWFEKLFAEDASPITAPVIKAYEPYHEKARWRAREAQRAASRFSNNLDRLRKSLVNKSLRDARMTRGRFFYVNTDIRYDIDAHEHMLDKGEACAYFDTKQLIDKIPRGAVVFLYRSSKWHRSLPGGAGIVGFGRASEKVEKRSYRGKAREAHCMKLDDFRRVSRSITAPEINELNRRIRGSPIIAFNGTSHEIDGKLGKKLYAIALRRTR